MWPCSAVVDNVLYSIRLSESSCTLLHFPQHTHATQNAHPPTAIRICRYDTNDDGRIDRGELQQLCQDAGRDMTPEEVKAALQIIDEDGNGCAPPRPPPPRSLPQTRTAATACAICGVATAVGGAELQRGHLLDKCAAGAERRRTARVSAAVVTRC